MKTRVEHLLYLVKAWEVRECLHVPHKIEQMSHGERYYQPTSEASVGRCQKETQAAIIDGIAYLGLKKLSRAWLEERLEICKENPKGFANSAYHYGGGLPSPSMEMVSPLEIFASRSAHFPFVVLPNGT